MGAQKNGGELLFPAAVVATNDADISIAQACDASIAAGQFWSLYICPNWPHALLSGSLPSTSW